MRRDTFLLAPTLLTNEDVDNHADIPHILI